MSAELGGVSFLPQGLHGRRVRLGCLDSSYLIKEWGNGLQSILGARHDGQLLSIRLPTGVFGGLGCSMAGLSSISWCSQRKQLR